MGTTKVCTDSSPIWSESWVAQAPGLLKKFAEPAEERVETDQRWTLDPEQWKPTTGLDELVFFWNNLPKDSEVELFLPAANVEEIFNFRSLRHAPRTVKIVDSPDAAAVPDGHDLPAARPLLGRKPGRAAQGEAAARHQERPALHDRRAADAG